MSKHSSSMRTNRIITWSIKYVVLCVIVLVILLPIYMMVIGGLKNRGELAASPYTFPVPPRFDNYDHILGLPTFWTMLLNSLFVMVFTTLGVVVVSSLTAYVFARLKFRAKAFMFNIVTMGLLFPLSIAILPTYLVVRQLHLTNNLWGVILPQIAFGLAVNIIILRGFFSSVPLELQDAAYIDGCTDFDFFWRILLPLVRPALSAVAVLTILDSWNQLFLPLVVLDNDAQWTLPLGTMQFMGQYGTDWAMVLAFVTLTMLPVILFYIFAEQQIVSGLTAGAVKG